MLIKDALFGVVDCETTGLDPEKDRVVEMAIVAYTTKERFGERWSCMFDPGIPIPPEACAVHHITSDDVHGLPSYDPDLTGAPAAEVYVAHNAAFDKSFLRIDKPFLCTMRLAQKLWPDLAWYGNQFLRYALNIKVSLHNDVPMHRALPDAIVTAHLLEKELQEVLSTAKCGIAPPTVEDLIAWTEKPILLSAVRFGKHKGLKWSEVPKDYLRWMLGSMTDIDVDTAHTAKYYLAN